MKEMVFYKNGHYLTLQKCTGRRKKNRYRKHSGKRLKGRQRKKKHPI
ncbi:hypothetical protein G4378_14165 [Dorea longicatena]|nr:hypothetical protein [Dorea longicatena]NSC57281.1 hypothetical protein [Dorea longicatena]NSD09606.1 hypothetical protein [Dorea longicatena]NSF13016.1 hypothetical protein [Dorea longicatena]